MKKFIFSCLLVLLTVCAQASDLYVSTRGSAANTGAKLSPLDIATLLTSTNKVAAGDTVWVHDGVYGNGSQTFTVTFKGALTNRINVRAYPGAKVTFNFSLNVDSQFVDFQDITFTHLNNRSRVEPPYTSPETTAYAGVTILNYGNRFINCVLQNNSLGYKINASPTNYANLFVYGTIIQNNGWVSTNNFLLSYPNAERGNWGGSAFLPLDVDRIYLDDVFMYNNLPDARFIIWQEQGDTNYTKVWTNLPSADALFMARINKYKTNSLFFIVNPTGLGTATTEIDLSGLIAVNTPIEIKDLHSYDSPATTKRLVYTGQPVTLQLNNTNIVMPLFLENNTSARPNARSVLRIFAINEVIPSNQAPTVQDVNVDVALGATVQLPVNTADPDGDEVAVTIVPDNVSHGVLNGKQYTAQSVGNDIFNYSAFDGDLTSAFAKIVVSVFQQLIQPIISQFHKGVYNVPLGTVVYNRFSAQDNDIDLRANMNFTIQSSDVRVVDPALARVYGLYTNLIVSVPTDSRKTGNAVVSVILSNSVGVATRDFTVNTYRDNKAYVTFIEAEQAKITPEYTIVSSPEAFGNKYVWYGNTNDVYSFSSTNGSMEIEFSVPEAGDYAIWTRALISPEAPDNANSFWISVDDGPIDVYDLAYTNAGQWIFDAVKDRGMNGVYENYRTDSTLYAPSVFSLTRGIHKLKLYPREGALGIDIFFISNDLALDLSKIRM